MAPIPTYQLYGDVPAGKSRFWLHCETIHARSSQHRWEIRPHRHDDFFQILYIEAGACTALLGTREQTAEPPAIITVPPRLQHGFRFSEDAVGLVITLLASHLVAPDDRRTRLGAFRAAPHIISLTPAMPDIIYMIETLRRLSAEFEGGRSGRNDLMAAYVGLVLQLTARLHHERTLPQSGMNLGEQRLERLIALIHRHFRDHKPVTFYAAELGLSSTHLNRVIRAATGRTPSELIAAKLIEEAKRDLLFSFAPIQAISYRLGFSDPAYFSRFFLTETGKSPLSWRRAERRQMDASSSAL